MGRRPICVVCLLWMLLLWGLDFVGFPLIRGNPLSEQLRQELVHHPKVTVVGEAVRCTQTDSSFSVYLKQVSWIHHSEKISIKNVRAYLKEKREVPAGALVLLSGTLEEVKGSRNPGEFDTRQYYVAQGIFYILKDGEIQNISSFHSVFGQFLTHIRAWLTEILEEGAGEDAPLFETMLLGEKQNLEMETRLRYQAAGILHILAISGLHISLLGWGIFRFCNWAGAGLYLSSLLAVLVMVPYGIMTGGSVSAMRTVSMFLVASGAKILGRSYDSLTALALAALLLLLEQPAYLFDSSFLMSFTAVLGIHAVAPQWKKEKGTFYWAETVHSSLTVQLTMLPVLLTFYGEVSLTGLVLNLLVIPSVGGILLSGIAGCGVGLILQISKEMGLGVGAMMGNLMRGMFLPGRLLLHVYELLCDWALQVPYGVWTAGCPAGWQIVLYYLVFALVVWLQNHFRKPDRKQTKKTGISVFYQGILFIVLLGNVLLLGVRPGHLLQITCLDVGQGDGIVIETPEHGCILIDGGSTSRNRLGSSVLLPFLKHQGISTLDAVFLSHLDEDHINGVLELLELMEKHLISLRIRTLVLPEWKIHSDRYEKLVELAKKNRIEVVSIKQGDSFRHGELLLKVLAPLPQAMGEDENMDSQVLLLQYREFDALFTGDIGMETEEQLLPILPDLEFLKVAHHGSRYSTGLEFLEKTKPELAVISCSETNHYGHPSLETIQRLEEAKVKVAYTMKNGAITVATDGTQIQVKSFVESSGT